MSPSSYLPTKALIFLCAFPGAAVILAAGATAPATGPAQQAQQQQQPPQQAATGYAGEDTCLACHEDMVRGYHDSAHGMRRNTRTPAAGLGCESCHGPGQAHADAGGDPELIARLSALPPDEANAACTACHIRAEQAFWDGSPHEGRDLSCLSCHSTHQPLSERAQLKAANDVALCGTCHRGQSMKMLRTGHMPVREGKMQCSSCHNAHGTANVRLLRVGNSITESCVSCHSAQRGPFLWEHAVGRDDCTVCHDPHGSTHDRMLVAQQPMLCQRCHIHVRHPSTVYDARAYGTTNANRLIGRSCVNCHQNVHGSNHPSGSTFLR
jgi:DmsE family decaheme c-type cytochrome